MTVFNTLQRNRKEPIARNYRTKCSKIPTEFKEPIMNHVPRPPLVDSADSRKPQGESMKQSSDCIPTGMNTPSIPGIYYTPTDPYVKEFDRVLESNYMMDARSITYKDGTIIGFTQGIPQDSLNRAYQSVDLSSPEEEKEVEPDYDEKVEDDDEPIDIGVALKTTQKDLIGQSYTYNEKILEELAGNETLLDARQRRVLFNRLFIYDRFLRTQTTADLSRHYREQKDILLDREGVSARDIIKNYVKQREATTSD